MIREGGSRLLKEGSCDIDDLERESWPFTLREANAVDSSGAFQVFVSVRARQMNRRKAWLLLRSSQTPLNGSTSEFPAIGRKTTCGKGVAIVASLVRLIPCPSATMCMSVSRATGLWRTFGRCSSAAKRRITWSWIANPGSDRLRMNVSSRKSCHAIAFFMQSACVSGRTTNLTHLASFSGKVHTLGPY